MFHFIPLFRYALKDGLGARTRAYAERGWVCVDKRAVGEHLFSVRLSLVNKCGLVYVCTKNGRKKSGRQAEGLNGEFVIILGNHSIGIESPERADMYIVR